MERNCGGVSGSILSAAAGACLCLMRAPWERTTWESTRKPPTSRQMKLMDEEVSDAAVDADVDDMGQKVAEIDRMDEDQ